MGRAQGAERSENISGEPGCANKNHTNLKDGLLLTIDGYRRWHRARRGIAIYIYRVRGYVIIRGSCQPGL
jgi:hypothetical protein